MNTKFYKKNIGIWGFGVVGKSFYTYIQEYQPARLQILDAQPVILQTNDIPTITLLQTPDTITEFLQSNDYIIASPGIPLHQYSSYQDKFISELDLFYHHTNASTIAITGTIGKTSITHLLTHIIKYTHMTSQAAGNIGTPMLSILKQNPEHVILELSSFQLQQSQKFATNLAIITNFYPNHLDHHQSIDEYFIAKCAILRNQTDRTKKALIPLELADKIAHIMPFQKHWALFTREKPSNLTQEQYQGHEIFYLDNNCMYSTYSPTPIFDITKLPHITFAINWLIIIAACRLYNIDMKTICPAINNLELPRHRLEYIGSWNACAFYNDSKATVWQSTLQAVQTLHNKPIKLFIGGLSKGTDRTPLFKSLNKTSIFVYLFGKEAQQLAQICQKFNIPHENHETLDQAWKSCTKNLIGPCNILFSPAGSSFDLFENYQARGAYFTKLVHDFLKNKSS